jgi:hypothetical protein
VKFLDRIYKDLWIYRIFSLKQKLDLQDFFVRNTVKRRAKTL